MTATGNPEPEIVDNTLGGVGILALMTDQPFPAFRLDVPLPVDAEALAVLHNSVWREAYAGLLPIRAFDEAALEGRRGMWRRMLTERSPQELRERLRIGRAPSGEPVGFLMIGTARDDDAPRAEELMALNVDSRFHGTGLAQALVSDLLGDRPACLWVVEDNPRARRFYEKLGFRADGGRKIDPDLDDLREIRMVR